jgi:peptidoglycan hydrolase-like protein with peptidoglycan-binding domain
MFNRPIARRARYWIIGVAVAGSVLAPPAAASPDPATSWHGRAIQRPEPRRSVSEPAWPRGWSAGSVAAGTGYDRSSRRVRAVQRELRERGFRVGRVDGRFGPRTRDAVTWFQLKHGLEPTGVVDAGTLAELRTRRAPGATVSRAPAPVLERVATTPTPTPTSNTPIAVVLTLLMLATLVLIALLLRAEARAHRETPAPQRRSTRTISRAVLGYIVVAPDAPGAREEVAAATAAIATWCDARDWQLERIIQDAPQPGQRPSDRPGLAYVLDRLAAGQTRGVVVRHLSDVAESAAGLAPMLQRINDADAFVMAVDDWLDTNLPPGRLSAGALVELGEWKRARSAAQTRQRSTASLGEVPELRARVVAMHEQGMSLQAIADRLNAAGVPTLRGGSQWRPAGVQVLAGYKPPPAQESLRRNG